MATHYRKRHQRAGSPGVALTEAAVQHARTDVSLTVIGLVGIIVVTAINLVLVYARGTTAASTIILATLLLASILLTRHANKATQCLRLLEHTHGAVLQLHQQCRVMSDMILRERFETLITSDSEFDMPKLSVVTNEMRERLQRDQPSAEQRRFERSVRSLSDDDLLRHYEELTDLSEIPFRWIIAEERARRRLDLP